MSDLGISKDLKPLVRQCQRAGWEVTVTGGNHVRWVSPVGWRTITSLTGSRRGIRTARRDILRQLQAQRTAA